jgi:hypothetical protein
MVKQMNETRLLCGPNALLTPTEKRRRLEWMANSRAREQQLAEIAGAGLSGYADDGALAGAVVDFVQHGELPEGAE